MVYYYSLLNFICKPLEFERVIESMKCNINKTSTNNALHNSDIRMMLEGLLLLERNIRNFIKAADFSQTSEETANENLESIASARKQLKAPKQSFSKNELKVLYVGINFLRDDIDAPINERSPLQEDLSERELVEKQKIVKEVSQKLTAAFSRMGIDIQTALRGF